MTTRTTFALGLALALGALMALVVGRLRVASGLSVLAALTSPVAGLFLGVAGGALFLSGRRRDGVTLGLTALVPTIAVGLAFGNVGRQSFAEGHAVMGFLVCLGVAGLCWRRPVVRWAALLSAVLVAAAYLLPTPVGTTATRLPELFAAPIIVAAATLPLVAVITATASLALLYRRYRSQRSESGAIPRSARSSMRPYWSSWPLVRLPGPLRSFRRCDAAKQPPWRRWFPSQEGGRDRSTPGATPSSTTELSTPTPTENGSTTTPSPMWPSLTGRTNGRRLMKRPWCAMGCRTCSRCGRTEPGRSMR